MLENKPPIIGHLTRALALGAAAGLAFVAAVIGLDFVAITSMIDSSRGGAVLASVFIIGSVTKGAVFAVALAVADFDRRVSQKTAVDASPATTAV